MKKMSHDILQNKSPHPTMVQRQYVRVIKNGALIAFKTVNNDWCIINTKINIRKGLCIVNTEPFASCKVMLIHISDFNGLVPGLQEIPATTKWPLSQSNN